MKLHDINKKIEEIEQKIFYYSLWNNLSITELGSIYCSLIKFRKTFLNLSLIEYSKEDIDSVRFKICENILNLKILIKERLKINYEDDAIQMEELCNNFAG